jgi:broad specificity phosphatase PhoE
MNGMSDQGPDVVLVRHGETEWSLSGRHTGRTDLDLTETGEAQAKAACALLGDSRFDLVLTSPMRRARRTAELAGLTPYELDEDLKEWDYGDFEGLTSDQIHERFPGWTVWRGPWPGGETAEDTAARADRVVRRILHLGPGARVAVVAHGHILRVVAARWLQQDVAVGRLLALDTATVSELGWEHDVRVVRRWNVAPA